MSSLGVNGRIRAAQARSTNFFKVFVTVDFSQEKLSISPRAVAACFLLLHKEKKKQFRESSVQRKESLDITIFGKPAAPHYSQCPFPGEMESGCKKTVGKDRWWAMEFTESDNFKKNKAKDDLVQSFHIIHRILKRGRSGNLTIGV